MKSSGGNVDMIFVIFASLLFGTYPSIQKFILASGVSPIALVIICNGTASVLSLLLCLFSGKKLRLSLRQLIDSILIGALGLFATDYLLNIAYTMIPVGMVTMIHFLYPTLVCVCMTVLFGEKMNRSKGAAIVLSIAGLVCLTGGNFGGSMIGIVIAAATSFAYAFYMIASDKSSAGKLDPIVRVFYTNTTVALTGLLMGAVTPVKIVFPATPGLWGLAVLVGAMLFSAIFLINIGIKKIGAGIASFINMLEPVTSLTVSAVVFQYSISAVALLGCALIISAMAFSSGFSFGGIRKKKSVARGIKMQ